MDDAARHFFISHSSADIRWAEWIAIKLEGAGYRVELDVRDWPAGTNFVAAMERALQRAERVIAVYSASYFAGPFAKAEYQAALTTTFRKQQPRVIPVQVEDCEIPELYRNLVLVDLVGVDEEMATNRLLESVSDSTQKERPLVKFPGRSALSTADHIPYPGHSPLVWRMPPRNQFFVGRQQLMDDVRSALEQPQRAAAVASLQGIGGIGKTQIVIEYAYQHASSYACVWWVDADTPTLITDGLLSLAEEMALTEATPERTLERLWRELRLRDDWLLIYDNVDEVGSVTGLQPPATGHWLLTSRNPAIGRVAEVIGVHEFERRESLTLLSTRVPSLPGQEAAEIAEALGDLPLAVEQAGYFLADTGFTAADYLPLLQEQPTAAGLNEATTSQHPGLVTVVTAAIERLETDDPEAARVLNLMCVLSPEPVPIAPMPADPDIPGGPGLSFGNAAETARIIRRLAASGLVKRAGRSLQMHRLVQRILANRLSASELGGLRTEAIRLLADSNPGDPKIPNNWPSFASLAPHVDILSSRELSNFDQVKREGFAHLIIEIINYYYRSGRYQVGLEFAQQRLSMWEEWLGPKALIALRLKNNLGMCLTGAEEFGAAAQLYRELHAKFTETLGPFNIRTLQASHNIGIALIGEGKFADAADILRLTLRQKQSSLGRDHETTLGTANHLAEALVGSGEHKAAKELAEKNLERQKRTLPPGHPDVLDSTYVLGMALSSSNPERAIELLTETRDMQAQILGENHPDTDRTTTTLRSIRNRM